MWVIHNGNMDWVFKNGKPRNVKYIEDPENYGFIPKTLSDKSECGNDALYILVLKPSLTKGTIQSVNVLGAIKLLDKGNRTDTIYSLGELR